MIAVPPLLGLMHTLTCAPTHAHTPNAPPIFKVYPVNLANFYIDLAFLFSWMPKEFVVINECRIEPYKITEGKNVVFFPYGLQHKIIKQCKAEIVSLRDASDRLQLSDCTAVWLTLG